MGNFKVKVNNEAESREVQDLFEVIGYKKGACSLGNYPAIIVTTQDWATGDYCSTRALGLDIPAHENYKEITIQELRDMVVLRRNDVNDATHESPILKYFKACDDWYYFDLGCTDKWQKSAGAKPEYYEKLKPIEKTMKEYLDKQKDGTYKLIAASSGCVDRDRIEIPEGAEIAIEFKNDPDEHGVIFYKDGGKSCIGENDNSWQRDSEWSMDQLLNENYHDGDIDLSHWIIWQRTPSLNDQYAEIEQVRQAVKLDGGNDSNHTADAMAYAFMGVDIEQVHQASKDNVNNPQHYNKGGVECIDAIEASMTPEAFKGYLKGNVQKYMWRYEQKGGAESLRKAQWYLARLVASMDS